jgi:hypothetical protein
MKKLGLKSKKAPSAQLLAEAGAEEEEDAALDEAESPASEE